MRFLRPAAGLVATALCVAYLVWKVDLHKTLQVLRGADAALLLAAYAVLVAALLPLAWRWQRLLASRGVEEPYLRLLRSYFVAYALGQLLPTSLGGDATRIYDVARRRPDRRGAVTGSVIVERVLGGFATLALAAIGVVIAVGRYDVGPYLWLELGIALGAVVLGVLMFSRRERGALRTLGPVARLLRVERPARSLYEGVHAYRATPRLLVGLFGLTLLVQAFRVLTIYLAGRAAHVPLSAVPYFVMGPLLFLVMLVPFTINGLAVRESFFVSFLTQLGVGADRAFVTGFLYFLLSVALALPGTVLLGLGSVRGLARGREASG
ncbi:MAG: flippase-like domain-containing protein [Thermoleophilia bacterium]|nr:flippase-like domain-containing protein [Thermoleophilia bacterium]